MKRTLITLCLLAATFTYTHAQTEDYWSDEVKLIPGLDVEIFQIDRSHSKLVFSIGFFGFSDVEGTFNTMAGTVLYNEADLTKMAVNLLIDGNSINTGSSFRDKDLKKADFFDTEKHRMLKFESKGVKKTQDGYLATGDLTMKGITREVQMPFKQIQKRFEDPFWGNMNIAFEGQLSLNRLDFDIHGGNWGDKVLSEEVKIEFTLLAKQPNTYKWGTGELSAKMNGVVEAMKEGGLEKAKQAYEALAQKEEIDSRSAGVVAKRLMQKNYFEEAIAYLGFALEKFPKQAAFYKDLAKAHAFMGNKEKALEYYEQIGARNPYDPETMMMLKRLR